MRSDIDRLMAERNLDAIVIEGPDGLGSANPAFNYMVKGQKLTGTVLKKRGEPAMLVHSPWEQMQAEETGLVLVPTNGWNMREIMDQSASRFDAAVEYRRRMFEDLGIGGRVGIYGTVEAGPSFALLAALSQRMPGLEIVAEFEQDLISAARLTKEPDEVERMRDVGRRTVAVVQAVVDFIKQGHADGDQLADANDKPLMIGDVHAPDSARNRRAGP